jgi:acyl-CoA thioesterase FadM
LRGEELLLTARVRVACLDLKRGKATAVPKELHEQLKQLT